MIDEWREWLYLLGFIPTIAFGGRMLIQWLVSESKGKSTVTPAFWQLSICGNLAVVVHSLIQAQFHVCITQACNAVISWRNLNLMQPPNRRYPIKFVLKILIGTICLTIFAFICQSYFFSTSDHKDLQSYFSDWFRIPVTPWTSHLTINFPLWWHLLGFLGIIVFSSRFWLQWWLAEKNQESYLGASFWWVSIIGDTLCFIYFFSINDVVNFIKPACASIVYARNLMLIYKQKTKEYG